jgi:hypothetical protein
MTACFWASFPRGLRRNTRADKLKLSFYFGGSPKQRPFFFGMLKPILKLLPV